MKKIFKKTIGLILIAIILSSCSTLKVVKVLKQGGINQETFKQEISFEERFGMMILRVEIKGKEYDFLLDTGAPNAISKELAKELKLAPVASAEIGDGSGKREMSDFVKINEIIIGGVGFKDFGALIYDMTRSVEINCLGIDGIIGANLMRKAIWNFDFEAKKILITNSKESIDISSSAHIIKFKPTSFIFEPQIDIMLGDYLDENVLVDMGANGYYNTDTIALKNISKRDNNKKVLIGCGSGSSAAFGTNNDTVFFVKIPKYNISGLTFENNIIEFSGSMKTLGTGFFSNYNVTIDWFSQELILDSPKEFSRTEIKCIPFSPIWQENKVYVGFTYNVDQISESGINIGDQVLAINNKDVSDISESEYCDLLYDIIDYEGKSMLVKFINTAGKEIEYTFYSKNLIE